MMTTPQRSLLIALTAMCLFAISPCIAAQKPVKVYILCGQSNMQGHAKVSTFDHIGMDPKTAPIHKKMVNDDGSPRVLDDVYISQIGSGDGKTGKLTAGFGAGDDKIGPEFTFGIYMREFVDEPIVIIKTAWGGKSLNTDFRPPSAGVYEFNEQQLENFKKQGKDIDAEKQKRAEASGHYYRLMMEHVKKVLGDLKSVYPDYDPKQGYELAGFVWFQAWNDMVDQGTYPTRTQPGGYDLYTKLMGQFIRDVRKDLDAPKMPFVIGVVGVAGVNSTHPAHIQMRKAMAAPAEQPEFKGNVAAVHTAEYWDEELSALRARGNEVRDKQRELEKDKSLSKQQVKAALDKFRENLYTEQEKKILTGASNADYHYMGSGKVMALIGKGFAEAIHELSSTGAGSKN